MLGTRVNVSIYITYIKPNILSPFAFYISYLDDRSLANYIGMGLISRNHRIVNKDICNNITVKLFTKSIKGSI